MKFTYETRLNILDGSKEDKILTDYAYLMSKVKRKLTALHLGENQTNKKAFCEKFEISSRQYNSADSEAEAALKAIHELKKLEIQNIREKIKTLVWRIKKSNNPQEIHYKKRKLASLEIKLATLEEIVRTGKLPITYGTNKLFRQQFSDKFETHDQWKQAWTFDRNYNFSLLGSKDETTGNQTCQTSLNSNEKINLRLRLPNGFLDKHLVLSDIEFKYGKQAIRQVILDNLDRTKRQALFFRFLKDKKGWKLQIAFEHSSEPFVSNESSGCLGVDLNPDHLAVVEIDRFGNLIKAKSIPLITYGKSSQQTLAAIGEAIKELVAWAVKVKKPIVVEDLDFSKKKTQLGVKGGKRYARMLSSFAYSKTLLFIRSRAFRHRIEVKLVNPAYTSLIGQIKFQARYGLTIHQAAALAVARRNYRFSERLPKIKKLTLLWSNTDQVTLKVPVRNSPRHVWSEWAGLQRKMKTANASHYRTKRKLLDPPGSYGPQVVMWALSKKIKPSKRKSASVIPTEKLDVNRHQSCSDDVGVINDK